jgi:hypothetical protein
MAPKASEWRGPGMPGPYIVSGFRRPKIAAQPIISAD